MCGGATRRSSRSPASALAQSWRAWRRRKHRARLTPCSPQHCAPARSSTTPNSRCAARPASRFGCGRASPASAANCSGHCATTPRNTSSPHARNTSPNCSTWRRNLAGSAFGSARFRRAAAPGTGMCSASGALRPTPARRTIRRRQRACTPTTNRTCTNSRPAAQAATPRATASSAQTANCAGSTRSGKSRIRLPACPNAPSA